MGALPAQGFFMQGKVIGIMGDWMDKHITFVSVMEKA